MFLSVAYCDCYILGLSSLHRVFFTIVAPNAYAFGGYCLFNFRLSLLRSLLTLLLSFHFGNPASRACAVSLWYSAYHSPPAAVIHKLNTLRRRSAPISVSVLYEIYLMFIEVFQLRGSSSPFATITFKVFPGTGRDFNGELCQDFDDVYVESDHGELPVEGRALAWTECDECESDRYHARRIYSRLQALGYQPA
jgi:hypothetical protein